MSLVAGFQGQLGVLHALILRTTRSSFGSHRLGYAWALVEPTLWVLTFWVLFAFGGRAAPRGMPPIAFLATGIVTFLMFRKTYESALGAVKGNKALLVFPHVTPLDFMLAAAALETVTLTIVFLILVCGGAFLDGVWTPVDVPLYVLLGLALAAALGFAFGLFMHAAVAYFPTMNQLRKPLMRPTFWISGLFFTAADLPSQIRNWLLYNPILHTVELVRGGWFPHYPTTYGNPGYVFAWILVLLFVGLTCERMVRAKV